MLFDPQYTQYVFDEYERRIQAHLIERVALKARSARANALAQLAGRGVRLAAGLATTTWRWGRITLHRVRWLLPSLGNYPAKTQ